MDLKKQLQEALDFLKSQGHDRATIEEKFGYSPNYIDQALVRPTNKVYKSILLYKEWVLCNTMLEGKQKGVHKFTPEVDQEYEARFERLMAVAEQNTDTINKISEAHLLMTKASLGVDVQVSPALPPKEPLLPDPRRKMTQGKEDIDSDEKEGKRKDTSKNSDK